MGMRIAFTIILNGLHHLKHNNFGKRMLEMFDYWIIVDGAAGNQGTSAWCKKMLCRYHNKGDSNDGTLDYLLDLYMSSSNNEKMIITLANGEPWPSKDVMVRSAVTKASVVASNAFLWQIDVDEQWTPFQLQRAEDELVEADKDTGMFLCDFYVGQDILARGDWGEGKVYPYRRLWRWKGQQFESHIPPKLEGGNGKEVLLSQRFKHYAYYFEQDVEFKSNYYTGYNNILKNWKKLQEMPDKDFPLPASFLVNNRWTRKNTQLIKEKL